MKAGVAFSNHSDPGHAGCEVAQQAVSQSGPPVLSILFTTDAYAPKAVLDAVLKKINGSKLLGFCCGGIITTEGVQTQGVGLCTLSGNLRTTTTLQKGLSRNPEEAGRNAGEALLQDGIQQGTVIALPDGFQADLSEVLRGLYNRMGATFRYIGGGAGDNLKFFKTHQFTEQGFANDALAAAVVDNIAVSTGIGHGWTPMGDPLVMTKVQGKIVYEIDGIPAFEAYRKRLGDISKEEFQRQGMFHPLGFPDVFGQYIIRDPLTVNDDNSINFVTEVPSHAVGNIMEAEIKQLIETAERAGKQAVSGVHKPSFVLLFDCISRVLLMGDRFNKEIRAIRNAVGPKVPLLGALTFGEIGSYEDVPLFHNKTTVVAVGGDVAE